MVIVLFLSVSHVRFPIQSRFLSLFWFGFAHKEKVLFRVKRSIVVFCDFSYKLPSLERRHESHFFVKTAHAIILPLEPLKRRRNKIVFLDKDEIEAFFHNNAAFLLRYEGKMSGNSISSIS